MTFKLKDVRPKTGRVINLKPYSGSPKPYRKSDVRRIKSQERAIEAMRKFVGQ